MITLQFHNQVLYHLAQFTSAVGSKPSQAVLKNKRNKTTSSSTDDLCDIYPTELASNSTEFVTCGININKLQMRNQELWITFKPGLIEPLCKIQKTNKWKTSFVSHWSFSKNKRDFPCSELTRPLVLPAIFLLNKQQCRAFHSKHGKIQSLSSKHERYFKTAHNIKMESERNPTMITRLKEWFKDNSSSTITKSSILSETKEADVEKITNLLQNSNTTANEKTKIMTAFVEGYEAGLQRKIKRPLVIKFIQFLIFGASLGLIFYFVNAPSSVFKITFPNKHEIDPEEVNATFDDIKGVDSAKIELKEIVEFLKNPEKFTSLGAKLPKGVLLVGPPGTGKTLLARAVAGEAGVPFFHSAGPEFDEVLVGQGARRVRELFKSAKEKAPCVIFIDEIDSVGSMRTNSFLHPYANQTVNQLLTEMDGFHQNEGVIVLGATNRHNDLDKAIVRPGRFDVHVFVDAPDYAGRKEIFQLYLSKIVARDIDIDILARTSTGFTGADIENMVNQAALRAAIVGNDYVTMEHLEFAGDKVKMGPEKRKLSDEESRRITAYHEGGHTLVAHFTKLSHLVHKATIIPRGQTGGHTAFLMKKESISEYTRSEILATLDVMMGGRAAEELTFGADKVTAGAYSDFQNATNIAENMVKRWGMSEKTGFRVYKESENFKNDYSPHYREQIDTEVKRILQEAYERSKALLKTHSKELKLLADALLKYETLSAEEIKAVLNGKDIRNDSEPVIEAPSTNVL